MPYNQQTKLTVKGNKNMNQNKKKKYQTIIIIISLNFNGRCIHYNKKIMGTQKKKIHILENNYHDTSKKEHMNSGS